METLVGLKFLYLLLGGLATFRLALLFTKEDGLAYIFRKIRRLPPPKSSAKQGLSCEWCMSVWAGVLVALYLFWRGMVTGEEWPLYWLGCSSIGIIINQQWTKGH